MCATKAQSHFEFINSYYSDLELDEQLVALIVRSPVSSGTIRSISHPSLPKGYTLITKKDLQWAKEIKVLDTKIPLLAYEKISYKGEAIALVCGPSIHTARAIIDSLDIQFTKAIEDEAIQKEENIAKRNEFSKKSLEEKPIDTEKKIQSFRIEKTYKTKKRIDFYKESPGCLCDFQDGTISIFSPSLWADNLLENVSATTNIKAENIFIKKTISNNRTESNIWLESYLASLAAYASLILEKPIILQAEKQNEQKFFYNSPEFSTKFLAEFQSDGKIISIQAHCQISCGAYPVFADEIINRTKVSSFGAYKIPNQNCIVEILKTPEAPRSIDVNAIEAHAQFAIEVLMQDIAMELNIFPHELRLKNLDLSKTPLLNLENSEIDFLIESSLERSNFLRRYAAYNLVAKDPELFQKHKPSRGIGLSIGFQGSSFASSTLENKRKELSISLKTDESVIIHAHTHSKQIANIWKQMASQGLSIPPEKIKLDPNYAVLQDKYPSSVHRNINITTKLIKNCAKEIEAKRFHEALPIEVKKSIITQNKRSWDLEKLEGKPYYSTAWSAAVIDLEIQTYSYEVLIKRVWLTIHAGKILNAEEAETSLKRSVLQQLSHCLPGHRHVNPSIEIEFSNSEEDPKEIGSLMENLIPSALHAALTLALQKPIPQLPLNYDSIFNLIQGNER